MRLFCSGDLHGDKILARKLARKAKEANADLVVLCGDITHMDEDPNDLIGPFLKEGQRIIFVHGNHESPATAEFWQDRYGVTHIHGRGRKYEELGLFGAGGANIGLAQHTEEEILGYLMKGHDEVRESKKKVMVTHVHPAGSKMEHLTQFIPGSLGIRKAIDEIQPDIAVCCHVHEAAGLEEMIGKTRVINVCRQEKIIDL